MSKEMEKFFTRGEAQGGRKIALSYPDGTGSPHWLVVCGRDSDTYSVAFAKNRQKIFDMRAEGKIPTIEDTLEATKRTFAACIIDWSFDEEVSPEAAYKFLQEAPQIYEELELLLSDRKAFFGLPRRD